MFSQIANRAWNFVVNPTAKLNTDFPLTWKKLGGTYVAASALFFFGSLVIPLGFVGFTFLLAQFSPDTLERIAPYIVQSDGTMNQRFTIVMLLISFLMGFGMEIAYLQRSLKREGHSLSKLLALNLDSVQQSSKLATFWALVWPAGLAFVFWLMLSYVLGLFLPAPHQDTAELVKTLVGGNLVAFGVIAAVLAPILEEVVFRGFLFNALRSNLRQGAISRFLGKTQGQADFWAVVLSSVCFSLMHLQFHPTTVLMLFLIGCVHAELYRRTGSLYSSIILHAMNNGTMVVMLALGASGF